MATVVVHPPLNLRLGPEAAEELAAAGLFADDAAGLERAFRRVTERWAESVAWARTLDPALLDEQVDGEWSYLQTMRHLIFATDAWITGLLLGEPPAYHPLGMPPAHAGDTSGLELLLDARPSLDDVVAARADRQKVAAAAFESATDATLADPIAGMGGRFTTAAALQVIVSEEAAHLEFATRDLLVLTGGAGG